MDEEHTSAIRIAETVAVIHNRYMEIFYTEENARERDEYNAYISETAYTIINRVYTAYFDSFLDVGENAQDAAKITYPLYNKLRSWIRQQMIGGIQLVIARRVVEGVDLVKIAEGSEWQVRKFVEDRFWDMHLDDVTDTINQKLIIKDTEQSADIIKNTIPEVDTVSVGFFKRYTGRLVWATVYGVLMAGWVGSTN